MLRSPASCLFLLLLTSLLLLSAYGLKKVLWDPTALKAEDTFIGNEDSNFGWSVDVSSSATTGSFVIVGAPIEGKAYVYKQDNDGKWEASSPAATLVPVGESSSFGSAVAIWGDYAIVGDSGTGKAFIFEMTAGEWGKNATVIDGYTDKLNFGCSVDITDSFAIVGASGANEAFVFEKQYNAGWGTQATVVFNNVDDNDDEDESEFGYSVSMTDTYALVGSPGIEKAYLFTRPIFFGATFGTTASYTLKDYAGFGYTKGRFGESVAVTNMHALVGAPLAHKAFFFDKENPQNIGSPGIWPQSPTATVDAYAEEDDFGGSVALTDSLAVVGAHGAGKAFIFAFDGASWDTGAVATLFVTWLLGSGDGTIPNFGASVAIDDSFTIVGANNPTAYTYVYRNAYEEVDAPSSVPSAVPTAFPTLPVSSSTVLSWEGPALLDSGAFAEGTGVHFSAAKTFSGLGSAQGRSWYLSLSVYGTGFGPSTSGEFVRFFVNDAVVDLYEGVPLQCAPIAPAGPVVYAAAAPTASMASPTHGGCTAAFVDCSSNINVTASILSDQGGSIKIGARSYGVVTSPCPYGGAAGNTVYLKFELSTSPQPTASPSPSPTSKPTSQENTLTASKQNKLGLKGWEQLQVVLAMGVVLAALGVAVAKTKEADKTAYQHSLLYSAVSWGALGAETASLWTVVVIFFSHGYGDLGSSLLVFLLVRMGVGAYVAWESCSGSSYSLLHLASYLSDSGSGAMYVLMSALTTLDPAFCAFFPWKDSQLIRWTRGYPNTVVYSLVQAAAVMLACIYLAIQISYLGSGGGAFSAERDLVLVVSTLLLGVRVLVVLTGCYYKRDLSALPSSATSGNGAGLAEDSVVGTATGDVEMCGVSTSPDHIPNKGPVGASDNPMHTDRDPESASLLSRKMRLIEDENKQLAARLKSLEAYIKVPTHAPLARADADDAQPEERGL